MRCVCVRLCFPRKTQRILGFREILAPFVVRNMIVDVLWKGGKDLGYWHQSIAMWLKTVLGIKNTVLGLLNHERAYSKR